MSSSKEKTHVSDIIARLITENDNSILNDLRKSDLLEIANHYEVEIDDKAKVSYIRKN